MRDIAIKIENITKEYMLGAINSGTLYKDMQSFLARKLKKEDPNLKIGSKVQNGLFTALNGINLEIKKGETIGLIGGNGAGKSTLLKLITRITAPTKGNIYINGKIASMLEVGTGFHQEMTGRENIYMNGAILGMKEEEIEKKIDAIIEFSECGEFIDTPVKRYSSGMYVKLAFSVAAHLDSDILIMDEVLAVGDVAFQKKCLNHMNKLVKEEGRTIIYVSHNMNTVRDLCNKCVVLQKGNIVFEGDVEEGIVHYLKSMKTLEDEISSKYSVYINSSKSLGVDVNNKLKFEAEFINSKNFKKPLILRSIVRGLDNLPVGTSFSEEFCLNEKESSKIFEFDVTGLVEGIYNLSFDLIYTEKVNEKILDQNVYSKINAMVFEVSNENKSRWNNNSWGNIKFSDTNIIK